MVIDKLLEYYQDLVRYCDDKKWAKFYHNYENDPEEYDGFDSYFKNSNDYHDDAFNLMGEISEYIDLTFNEIPPDKVNLLDDMKQNTREWLDNTSRYLWHTMQGFEDDSDEIKGFLLHGYKMLKWIETAARKTPDEFYGGYRRGETMPYFIGESFKRIYKATHFED